MSESQSRQQLTWMVHMLNTTSNLDLAAQGIPVPTREQIEQLQAAMVPLACALPEPVHRFAPGLYMRELEVPAGMLIVGKIHKHEHPLMIMSGLAIVVSEFGNQIVKAGDVIVSPPGIKRVVLAVQPTRFLTVHLNPSNTTDLEALEAEHIEAEALSCGQKGVL